MKIWKIIAGRCRLQITCADTVRFLNTLTDEGISVFNAEYRDELIVRLTVRKSDFERLRAIADKCGASVTELTRFGAFWTISSLRKRPILLILVTILLFAFFYLPTRVLFVSVEGNEYIPTNQIIEAAAECGIGFGASRRKIRSEKVKNALLQKIPQLRWAGINTSGCTAVISVKEKSEVERGEGAERRVSSIVAIRDGVIQDCTVVQGNPLCTIGQAVKAGQTLVSGYVDCGNYIQATQANAEIRALTSRNLEVIAPVPTYIRGELIEKRTVYSIRVGKKLIKLTKDSGILGASCAKIYSEECMHLSGDFQLPVTLIKETYYIYGNETYTTTSADDSSWLYAFTKSHLLETMIAGQIISEQAEINVLDGASYLNGKYACIEMIGQVKYEQTILKDGTND